MAKQVIDRRAARTRAKLQQAHLALIRERGYDAVTVRDICAAARVARSTFYAHYAGKDDLKRKSLDHLRRFLDDRRTDARSVGGGHGPRSLWFSLPMFEHARDHLDLYKALAGTRGGIVALATIRTILSDLIRRELATPEDPAPRQLAVEYVVGAYMAGLTWWLDRGATPPAKQVDAVFRRFATHGLASSCP